MKRLSTYIIPLAVAMLTFCRVDAQDISQNYKVSRTMLRADKSKYLDRIEYFDGLGFPKELIQKGITPSGTNLVSITDYNVRGMEEKEWLPVPSSENYTEPASVRSSAVSFYSDTRPFTSHSYEQSPAARPLSECGPGVAWTTKSKEEMYLANNASDSLACKHYRLSQTGKLTQDGLFQAGELYVTKTTDEDGKRSFSFKDKTGRLIMTRKVLSQNATADTYTVYDDYGNLRYVLQPMFQARADTSLYAYSYAYDERNRCSRKKMPGTEPVVFIYDNANRLVFSQDGNQRNAATPLWSFYLYDKWGRIVLEGTCTNTNTSSAAGLVLQTSFSTSDDGIGLSGYSLDNFSLSSPTVQKATYYDSYDFRNLPGFLSNPNFPEATISAAGLKTAEATTLFDTTTRILSATYYDRQGRPQREVSSNHMGGYETLLTTYTFSGKKLTVTHYHTATGKAAITEWYSYTYDNAERLSSQTHKLNTAASVTLASYNYDQLGRQATTKYHGADNNNYSYAYNLRGWLTNMTGPAYAMNIYYNSGPGTACYNGNISALTWRNGNNIQPIQGYKFTYDTLDRLTTAVYGEGQDLSTNEGRYSENIPAYDLNGNILALTRCGPTGNMTFGTMDNITMIYEGNKLTAANDAIPYSGYGGPTDFHDGSSEQVQYTHDANGNISSDANSGVENITYNRINLPEAITYTNGTATYLYGTDGIKRRTSITEGGRTTTTDYCGNIIYKNDSLYLILIDEGYITMNNNSPQYHYFIKDHLGSNRVVISSTGNIEQQNAYYPFGGQMAPAQQSNLQPFKYNGKEQQTLQWLYTMDYGARWYNPSLARWTTLDPMSEKYYEISCYTYCMNNPIRLIDINGTDTLTFNWTGKITSYKQHKGNDVIQILDSKNNLMTTQLVMQKNSILFGSHQDTDKKKGTSYDVIAVNGDKNGENLFHYLSNNFGIEFSLAKTGNNPKDINYITTSHEKGYESSMTYFAIDKKAFLRDGLREISHNHPGRTLKASGQGEYDKNGDTNFARVIRSIYGNNVKFFIYIPKYGNQGDITISY